MSIAKGWRATRRLTRKRSLTASVGLPQLARPLRSQDSSFDERRKERAWAAGALCPRSHQIEKLPWAFPCYGVTSDDADIKRYGVLSHTGEAWIPTFAEMTKTGDARRLGSWNVQRDQLAAINVDSEPTASDLKTGGPGRQSRILSQPQRAELSAAARLHIG
jgi:hypothetical protein